MPREIVGGHEDWMRRAKSALVMAQSVPPGVFWEDLCYQAQQAAEKAFKAVFIAHGLSFRFTHDVEELFTGLRRLGVDVPTTLNNSAILTMYATETRYPGRCEPLTEEDHARAIKLAVSVYEWAGQEISRITKPPHA